MLLIEERFVNQDENCIFGSTEPYEPFTENVGQLFRSLRKDYGRCTGHVYQDTKDGTIAIGWVFLGRDNYEGESRTYLREVWVTLFETCKRGDPSELSRGGRDTGLKFRVLKRC
jgi:hypothetical protein